MVLKEDFSDGDILYAGTINDADKLNGITHAINNINYVTELYSGTDLNFSVSYTASTGTHVDNTTHTFNDIDNSNLVNKKYIVINILYDYGMNCYSDSINLNISEKYLGGTYSSIFNKKLVNNTLMGNIVIDNNLGKFQYIYELNTNDLTNGVSIKIDISNSLYTGNYNSNAHFTISQISFVLI